MASSSLVVWVLALFFLSKLLVLGQAFMLPLLRIIISLDCPIIGNGGLPLMVQAQAVWGLSAPKLSTYYISFPWTTPSVTLTKEIQQRHEQESRCPP